MKRQSPYGDANMMNPYAATQMQQVSVQRMQQTTGLSTYSGQMGSLLREEDRSYASSANADGQWQWDRDTQQMSPHLYREDQSHGSNENRSFYQNQMSDPKLGLNQEPRVHLQVQDMDVGREDNSSLQTFEGLEQKFSDDIKKVTKEHMDAEDEENARHREKILDINNQYQEQLVALRARYAARREVILQKESQARSQQYQLTTMRQYQNDAVGPADLTHRGGYGAAGGGGGPFPSEAQPSRTFAGRGHFNNHRQRRAPTESYGRGRMQGTDSRAPPSSGRGYNTGPRYY